MSDTLQADLDAARREIAKLKHWIELLKRERDSIPLCPDCRDKVRHEQECLRCQIQRASAIAEELKRRKLA